MSTRLFSRIGACAVFLLLAHTAQAQDAQPATTIAQGTVVDSSKKPLARAQIHVIDSATSKLVATTQTDSTGEFTVRDLKANTAYYFSIRQIGYISAASKLTTPKEGDTLFVDVILQSMANQLKAVTVKAEKNAAYQVDAQQIAKLPVQNALDVVLKYRNRMLGDAYKECRPDTSHLGPPQAPAPPKMPTMASAGGRGGRGGRGGGGGFPQPMQVPQAVQTQTFFDTSLAMHGYPPPPQLADPSDTLGKDPTRLYINGVLHGEYSMKNILQGIPSSDIAEMHYIDCWDTDYPLQYRNALFVVLKPGKSY